MCFAGTRLQSRGRGNRAEAESRGGVIGMKVVKRWSRRANLPAEGQLYSFTREVNSEKKKKIVK